MNTGELATTFHSLVPCSPLWVSLALSTAAACGATPTNSCARENVLTILTTRYLTCLGTKSWNGRSLRKKHCANSSWKEWASTLIESQLALWSFRLHTEKNPRREWTGNRSLLSYSPILSKCLFSRIFFFTSIVFQFLYIVRCIDFKHFPEEKSGRRSRKRGR